MTKTDSNPVLLAKKAAGRAAVNLIKEGMLIGLGTGSTVAFFIEALGQKCQTGLKISAVATSQQSTHQAQQLGIPLLDPANIRSVDLTVDGADEIDPHKNMIKGGGGALLREKMMAYSSQEMVVIIDETKLVDQLGTTPLPVEIAAFLYQTTLQRLHQEGYRGTLRLNRDLTPFITDNGNYIFDIQFPTFIQDPKKEHQRLKNIIGVLETGLFFDIAGHIVIGYEDGCVKIQN